MKECALGTIPYIEKLKVQHSATVHSPQISMFTSFPPPLPPPVPKIVNSYKYHNTYILAAEGNIYSRSKIARVLVQEKYKKSKSSQTEDYVF